MYGGREGPFEKFFSHHKFFKKKNFHWPEWLKLTKTTAEMAHEKKFVAETAHAKKNFTRGRKGPKLVAETVHFKKFFLRKNSP